MKASATLKLNIMANKTIRKNTMKILQGYIFRVSGHSRQLWIEDYDVYVDAIAIVEETPSPLSKKVLVTLDEIDKDRHVCVAIRRSALKNAI